MSTPPKGVVDPRDERFAFRPLIRLTGGGALPLRRLCIMMLFSPLGKLEFARLRLEAIAAAFLVPDGSAKQRPPVGVGGKRPHPSASKDADTFPKGEGKEESAKSLPLQGKVARSAG